jgi:hypothetical protein
VIEDTTVGEIVVTGSRVIKNGDASPSPVTVVQTEDVLRTQPGTLADALQVLPVFAGSRGSGVNPTSTGSVGAGNASANQLNLRNIGPNRTLVLLDGLRVPPTLLNGVVDVDVIPQMLVSARRYGHRRRLGRLRLGRRDRRGQLCHRQEVQRPEGPGPDRRLGRGRRQEGRCRLRGRQAAPGRSRPLRGQL